MTATDNLPGAEYELEEMVVEASSDARYLTYIRPIQMGESIGYAVCSEDGSQLAVFATPEAAFFSARQHNLIPMRVH